VIDGERRYHIKLGVLADQLGMEVLWPNNDSYKNIKVYSRHINRLGLDLIGSLVEFDKNRIVLMGESERIFLNTLSATERAKSIATVFSYGAPAIFITRSIEPHPEVLSAAAKYSIPVLVSSYPTFLFIKNLTSLLEEYIEPRITRPAGFMSIHGEGVLITGESGIGKSEVELELLNRGHKFVSDDITEIRRFASDSLLGFPPGNVSKFVEVRGIGIINVQQLFGINAIKNSEKIDMVVNFEMWQDGKEYERLGNSENFVRILGITVPYVSIPVRPGKNLAAVTEVAAMNNRLKKFGLDPYGELADKLGVDGLTSRSSKEAVCIWDISHRSSR